MNDFHLQNHLADGYGTKDVEVDLAVDTKILHDHIKNGNSGEKVETEVYNETRREGIN